MAYVYPLLLFWDNFFKSTETDVSSLAFFENVIKFFETLATFSIVSKNVMNLWSNEICL